jgi:phage regulator Rha-like protein
MKTLVPIGTIQEQIFLIRGYKVMLDSDLAKLYGVRTKELNKAVKRNPRRFPSDFMFQLDPEEQERLRFQIGTSKEGRGGRRSAPYAFTQEGVAMLSSILRSHRAIEVNVAIMRAFVDLRQVIAEHRDVAKKIGEHETKITGLTADVQQIFQLILPLLDGPVKKIKRIGFKADALKK